MHQLQQRKLDLQEQELKQRQEEFQMMRAQMQMQAKQSEALVQLLTKSLGSNSPRCRHEAP